MGMRIALEPLEARVLLSDSPVITSLPAYVGNEGVYISIQNQAVSDDGGPLTATCCTTTPRRWSWIPAPATSW